MLPLNAQGIAGVRFDSVYRRVEPGFKFGGDTIPMIRLTVTDRNAVRSGHVAAAVLWALTRVHPDSLKIRDPAFDERFGSSVVREAIVRGADPDQAMESQRRMVEQFMVGSRRYLLYR